ncbi:MAG: MBL fold metallo-hydrolase [Deltaproteobacteria bacterium]|nr:MBL fold metallo-hydrolase [Deltaproteobacteria bacterium]
MEERSFGPIRFLPGENRGRYPFCHSLYIEGAGVLIDPASDRERLIRLRAEEEVKMVWLSHWHEDHFMHLDLFDDLPLWISPWDAPPLADLQILLDWYGLNDQERIFWEPLLREQFHYRPRKPACYLMDGETILLGDLSVDVIATPGHTPGHLAFLFREPSVLFAGDYDLTRFGPWYGDLFSDIDETRASLDLLRGIPAHIVLTGHETGFFEDSPAELWRQYGSVIAEREKKLLALLEQPRTLEEIVNSWIIYGRPREPKAFFAFGERVHMIKHLEHLKKRGIILLENGRYRKVDAGRKL